MIPRTKEFFISLKDHDEWGLAHTVWGEVSSPAALNDRLPPTPSSLPSFQDLAHLTCADQELAGFL